jgi:hypothetical protein
MERLCERLRRAHRDAQQKRTPALEDLTGIFAAKRNQMEKPKAGPIRALPSLLTR